jgi:hypothetical protein
MGNNTSSFIDNLDCHVIFDKMEAENRLNVAEQQDLYMEECLDQTLNATARKQLSYRPNRMSVNDHQRANAYLESAKQLLPKRLRSDLSKVHIIQLMPTADDGMPHTRPGDIICYPDLSQLFSLTTLKHELWHIHQRKYQDMWLNVFAELGWKPWSGKSLPAKLEEYRRYNPDTIDAPHWVFRDTWVPVPVFRDITRPRVSDIDVWFYHVIEKHHTKKVPSELSMYFPHLPAIAYEHPREITAYMLAEPDKHASSRGFQDLVKQIGHISL